MRVPAFITVRTSSSRLPRKCLLPFGECNVIEHIIHRAIHYQLDPIICTSIDPSDDILEEIAHKEGGKVFRGSMLNKLKRWYDCCNYFNIDKFHTVDADDPFFDGELMKESMLLLEKGYDVVCPTESSSEGDASVGYSLTKEVIEKSLDFIEDEEDTEMMWYYLEKVRSLKKVVLPNPNNSPLKVRLTLDYEEDYWLLESVRKILGNLTTRQAIDELFLKNPDLHKINWFRNKAWKEGQQNMTTILS
jgi:spore coat polysaccharide biosynthesis protein SpsF